MAFTVSDHILERLNEWGVTRIYGYPGDGINGLLGALDRASERISFIQSRHEELSAFMACAHAKFTGEVGVCMATSGPGAIHLLNGLYDAKLDRQPVLAIVGQQSRMALGGQYQQEVDLVTLFRDVAHEYVHMASTPEQIRHLVDRAMRIARVERTVTCLIIPHDLQELDAVRTPPRKHGTVHSGTAFSLPVVVPRTEDFRRAADILNAGKKVAMLIGAGALGAADEVIRIADLLGAGVAKALLGKAALPDDLPFVTGAIGLLGTRPSWNMMSDSDTLLVVGSSFPYSEFLPKEGQARGIQIDIDGRMLGIRYPMELNLIGDSAETLRALAPLLQRKEDRSWRTQIEQDVDDWWKVLEARAMNDANPINPQRVFHGAVPSHSGPGDHRGGFRIGRQLVRPRYQDPLGHDGLALGDVGDDGTRGPVRSRSQVLPSQPLRPRDCGRRSDADERHQRPDHDREVLAGVERSAVCRARAQQPRPQSGDVGAAGARRGSKVRGYPGDPDFPYARYAESLGLMGVRVDHPSQIVDAIDRVINADRPALLEAIVDPNVPPLPPHISFEQAKNFASSIFKGDAEALGFIKQTIKDTAVTYLPQRK